MFEHIVVPLDGSPLSDAAFSLALGLGRDRDREIVCLHAVDTRGVIVPSAGLVYPYNPTPLIDALKSQGEAILADALAKAKTANVRITTQLVFDDPVSAVTRVAQDRRASVIIMGTHGRTGLNHLFLGSTAEGILRSCSIPVITTRGAKLATATTGTFTRALVAIDDSDPADAAIAMSIALGESERTQLNFCTVVQTDALFGKASDFGYDPLPYIEEVNAAADDLLDRPLRRAIDHGLSATTFVAEGKVVEEILKSAGEIDADLIVIGSHGRRGLRRFFVGSVAEELVRTSFIPVLVVRTERESTLASLPRTLETVG